MLDSFCVRATTAMMFPLLPIAENKVLVLSIFCEPSNKVNIPFGECAQVYPGKVPLRDMQAEIAGEYIEIGPLDSITQDTHVLLEGDLGFG